jgi:lipoprotein-releasing system permease protein
MLNNIPLAIGLRYIRAKRRNQFISFVSGFSLLGMALGVMALITVMSVMNGFDREMKQRLLRVIPHGFVTQAPSMPQWPQLRERLLSDPRILAAAPFVQGFALASYRSGVHGVQVAGIDPALQPSVSAVANNMLIGELKQLRPGEFGVVLGAVLARQLRVVTGDKITLTLPDISITPAGVYPRVKRFTVVGVFEVHAPVDQELALIHLADAQKLYRTQAPMGLQFKVTDIYQAGAVVRDWRTRLHGAYQWRDWSQTQGSLFQAVKMEKIVIGVLLSIIIAVAAFNIVSSLVLMVADKRSDIAVLRTLGLNARQIMGIFMVQGCGVGFIGTAVGALAGVLLALYISPVVAFFEALAGRQVFDANVYFISHLPSHLQWADVLIVCFVALLLSVLATLYPAWRAARIQPAEALRYE